MHTNFSDVNEDMVTSGGAKIGGRGSTKREQRAHG